MQAYGEGYELLRGRRLVTDVPAVLQSWSQGTVIRSWLLDLLVCALKDDPGWPSSAATSRTPARAAGRIEEAIDARGADAGDLRGAVRPVRLPAGRLAGDEGGRGAAPAVRRARGARSAAGPPASRASTPGRARHRLHADWRAPRRSRADMHLRRLAVADFRSWTAAEVTLEPGVTVLVGPNGVGKTNLVEAVGYLATLGLAPGGHRRAADPARRRAGRGARRWWCTTAGSCASSWRSPRARRTGPGSTGRRCRGRGTCSASCARCCSRRRTWRWSAATRPSGGGSWTSCWCRAPAVRGVRADYERVLQAAHALLKTAGARPVAAATCAPSTCGTGTSPRHGAELLAGRLELVAALAAAGRRGVRRGRRRQLASRSRCGYRVEVCDGELPADAAELRGAAAGRAGPGAPAGGGARRVPGRPAPRRPGAAPRRPAGQGVRQPRRVLVVRAGAAARRRTGCCVADGVEPVLVLDDVFAELDAPAGERWPTSPAGRAGAGHRGGGRGRARTGSTTPGSR